MFKRIRRFKDAVELPDAGLLWWKWKDADDYKTDSVGYWSLYMMTQKEWNKQRADGIQYAIRLED